MKKLRQEDKYYYFPTMTKNIALIRGEKYIYLCKYNYNYMTYGEIYKLVDFDNDNWQESLKFFDNSGKKYYISCWDIGSFVSVKEWRKNKLKKLNGHKS